MKVPKRVAWILGHSLEIKNRFFNEKIPFTRFRVECATRNMTYNMSKARKELGFNPKVGIKEGVKRTVDWYKGGWRS